MICKWCGSNLKRTDVNCPSCGQKTPPLSDCGGLYDLRYKPQDPPPAPVVTPTPAPVPGDDRFSRYLAQQEEAKMKTNRLITIAGFVLLLICIVLLMFRLNSLNSKYNKLESKINNLSAQQTPEPVPSESSPEGSEPVVPEGTTEATEPEIIPEETVYTLGITIDEENESISVKDDNSGLPTDLEPATDADDGTYTVSYTQDDKDMLFVKVSKEQTSYKRKELYVYQIEVNTALPQFAGSEPQFTWKYRTSPEAEYTTLTSIPDEGVEVYENGKLVLPQAYLDKLESEKGSLELCCVVEITNKPAQQPEQTPDTEENIFDNIGDVETAPEETIEEFTEGTTEPDEPVSNEPIPEEETQTLVITVEGFYHAINMTEIHTEEQENEQ